MFSCEFCEIFKNKFFNRARLVAASEMSVSHVNEFIPGKLGGANKRGTARLYYLS